MSDKETETEFVLRVQDGDLSAFEELLHLHGSRLRAFVAMKLPIPHLIDEIAHEAFVFAHRNIHDSRRERILANGCARLLLISSGKKRFVTSVSRTIGKSSWSIFCWSNRESPMSLPILGDHSFGGVFAETPGSAAQVVGAQIQIFRIVPRDGGCVSAKRSLGANDALSSAHRFAKVY